MAPESMQLPVSVATPGDINRLLRELAAIDEQFLQLRLRQAGAEIKLPKTSQLLDQSIGLNQLNLLQADDRLKLQQTLTAIQQRAPVLHLSFSADPSPAFMVKLMVWLRREIHPFVLVVIGLQPGIGAGCTLRTTNHSFDFTLVQSFAKHRQLLIERLKIPTPSPAPPSPEEVTA